MAVRFDKFTLKAQEAVQRAQELALDGGHPQIDALHLLAGLLAEPEGIVRPILEKIGADQGQLNQIVEAELGHVPKVTGGSPPQMSKDLDAVFQAAMAEADAMHDEFASVEHLLLALAKVDSKAKNILKLNAIEEKQILEALKTVRGSTRVTDQTPEDKFQALEKYGIDLVAQANQGKLDPVIGRDQEIRRVIQVLSRRRKNNPVLIGEPGVGKTAIVEGLALRITQGDVPTSLKSKRVIALEDRLRHLADIDGLTGLLNRRAIDEHAQAELDRSSRGSAPCSIALVDVDHFKQVNDTFGHDAGDRVLRAIAASISRATRSYDWVGRWGGDEFLIVLPGASGTEASSIADRICRRVGRITLPDGSGEISVSIGIASAKSGESRELEDLVAEADAALYRVKGAGGDGAAASSVDDAAA